MLTNAAGPFAQCHAKVPVTLIFNNCVFDVCANNGDERVLRSVSRPNLSIVGKVCLLYFVLCSRRPTVTHSIISRYNDSNAATVIQL